MKNIKLPMESRKKYRISEIIPVGKRHRGFAVERPLGLKISKHIALLVDTNAKF
nr:hypothetical protein [Coriobacterium glomerans]